MGSAVGTDRLREEFEEKIDYFRKEYEISYAEVIGVLRIVARGIEDEMVAIEKGDECGEYGA